MTKYSASLPSWQPQPVPIFLFFDRTNRIKAAAYLPVTESATPTELQRGHFYRARPAFAQMKRRGEVSCEGLLPSLNLVGGLMA